MLSDAQVDKLMDTARKKIAEMSEDELEVGFAPPEHGDIPCHLRTAMCAIICGIQTEDWNAVAEGEAMLEQIHLRMTGILYTALRPN